jgi:predicted SAM-dependent methyltransferase
MHTIKNIVITLVRNIRRFCKFFAAKFDRESIACMYIKGRGIEIGALHSPLQLPKSVKAKYIDRMSTFELKKQYPELKSKEFLNVDIIDDGEHLSKIKDSTQDFVIANHFLEHCQNPIGAIGNMLRVLKNGGVLYLSIPDKRYSFDADRPQTSIDHILRDYQEGPEWSKEQHFDEWTRYIANIKDAGEADRYMVHLMNIDYSIHYHAWTQTEIIELVATLKKKFSFGFEVELIFKNIGEVIIILKKTVQS